jgi:transcriptional regulator with XRE-family HTH domain
MELTQIEIGKRISELRKQNGLSQDELAKLIRISRPSLAQIELGKRYLDVNELAALAKALGFSLDDFMSERFLLSEVREPEVKYESPKTEERISVPELSIEKFKNVWLYLVERCAGKPNVGETVLHKLLYFADFNYYELYEEHLTGARYRKLPFGPVAKEAQTVINQMIADGQLKKINVEYHGLPQKRYVPLEKADLKKISAAEIKVIDEVIQQMGDWNGSKISDYSHKDMPWMATTEGDYIDYNLAFYRELPYSVRNYDNEE